jgi:hypothetical protein
VRRTEVVTADGEPRRTTADIQPDPFRAVRGGEGASGLVTDRGLFPVTCYRGCAAHLQIAAASTSPCGSDRPAPRMRRSTQWAVARAVRVLRRAPRSFAPGGALDRGPQMANAASTT